MITEPSMEKILEFAIKTEEVGEHLYTRLASQFENDAELQQLFKTLAGDERVHRSRFATLLEKLPPKEEPIQYEQEQYLRAMSISAIFSSPDGIGKGTEAIAGRDDALQRALELEKSSLLYYDAMRDILGQNDILNAVIQEEKGHVAQVMKYLITDAKMRGLSDKFHENH